MCRQCLQQPGAAQQGRPSCQLASGELEVLLPGSGSFVVLCVYGCLVLLCGAAARAKARGLAAQCACRKHSAMLRMHASCCSGAASPGLNHGQAGCQHLQLAVCGLLPSTATLSDVLCTTIGVCVCIVCQGGFAGMLTSCQRQWCVQHIKSGSCCARCFHEDRHFSSP